MSLTNIQSLLRELDMRGALEQFNAYVNNPQELEATSIDTILTICSQLSRIQEIKDVRSL